MTSCVMIYRTVFCIPLPRSTQRLFSVLCIASAGKLSATMAVWHPHQPPYFLFCLQLNFSRVLSGCCLPLSSQVTPTLLLFPSLQMCSPTTVDMTASDQIQRLPQWTWPYLINSRGYHSEHDHISSIPEVTTVNMTISDQIQRLPQWPWPQQIKSRGYFSVVTFLLTLTTVKTGHFSLNFLFPLILCHGVTPLPHSSPLLLCLNLILEFPLGPALGLFKILSHQWDIFGIRQIYPLQVHNSMIFF